MSEERMGGGWGEGSPGMGKRGGEWGWVLFMQGGPAHLRSGRPFRT